MEVTVDFVAWTALQATVNVSVVELESVEDVNVVVEVLAVHDEDVLFVGDVEAAVLVAVEVYGSEVRAERVGTLGVLLVRVKALGTILLDLNTNSRQDRSCKGGGIRDVTYA